MEATNIRVQPKEIPAADFETACVIINDAIRHLLRQPKEAEEYRKWKEKRESKNAESNE